MRMRRVETTGDAQMHNDEPLVPWQTLRQHVRGRNGRPISVMTLHRWRDKSVIEVHQIGGLNYIRLRETLARLAPSASDSAA
jgi:hypothetical protein